MKAKQFFMRARSAERDIRRLESMRDHYMAMGATKTAQIGGIGSRTINNSSKVERAVLGALEAEMGISEELNMYRQIIREAENVISRVPQERFREILTLHYLAGMALADIARSMGYKHTENLYRAHGWALAAAQKIIDDMGTK